MKTILAIAVVLATSVGVVYAGERELVRSCNCTAGGLPSQETHDWYVQVGVFTERDAADALIEQLTRRGLRAESYPAGWLWTAQPFDGPWYEQGPFVVVSWSRPTRKAATRLLRRYRKVVPDAFVRQFLMCPDESYDERYPS